MNRNLKNRHRCEHDDRQLCNCCFELNKWFEEFEKELREYNHVHWVLKNLTDDIEKAMEINACIQAFIQKEILGDEV